MAIPQGRLSTTPVPGIILPPDSRQFHALINYEKGPVAVENTTEGLLYQDWTLTWDPGTGKVWLTPETTGSAVDFQTIADIKHITFAFDQNGRVSLAYSTSVSSFLYWYDTALGVTVTTDLGSDVRIPALFLDDKRDRQSKVNDMLLWYTKLTGVDTYSLYMKRQRDRFLNEYLMDTDLPAGNIENIGMSDEIRVQIVLASTGSIPTPDQSYLGIMETAQTTGWVDLSLFSLVTFEDLFGQSMDGPDFTKVIDFGAGVKFLAKPVTSRGPVEMAIVDSLDAGEIYMSQCSVNGSIGGSLHYIGFPLSLGLDFYDYYNNYIVIASDTGKARIRKIDKTPKVPT